MAVYPQALRCVHQQGDEGGRGRTDAIQGQHSIFKLFLTDNMIWRGKLQYNCLRKICVKVFCCICLKWSGINYKDRFNSTCKFHMKFVFCFENLNKKSAAWSKVLHCPSPQDGLVILRRNKLVIKGGIFIEIIINKNIFYMFHPFTDDLTIIILKCFKHKYVFLHFLMKNFSNTYCCIAVLLTATGQNEASLSIIQPVWKDMFSKNISWIKFLMPLPFL